MNQIVFTPRRYVLALASIFLGGCAHSKPAIVRVLTYNIHHGIGMDNKLDLQRTAEVIKSADADLVAMQEVDRGTERSGKVDQLQKLAELTGTQGVFGKTIDWQGGDYGIAVLSRLPVDYYYTHPLPNVPPHEKRALLEVGVRVADRPLAFFTTDLDDNRDEAERIGSIEVFQGLVRQRANAPIILAGDFFLTPDHPVLQPLFQVLHDTCPPDSKDVYTAPAGEPHKRIDLILYGNSPHLQCTEYRVLPEPMAAQHRPVLAVFELTS